MNYIIESHKEIVKELYDKIENKLLRLELHRETSDPESRDMYLGGRINELIYVQRIIRQTFDIESVNTQTNKH